MTAHASWRCQDCNERGEGAWAPVDRSAERHVKTEGHSTITRATGSRRVRDEQGTRDYKGAGK